MDNVFLQYTQTGINDDPNNKIIYNNDKNICVNEYENFKSLRKQIENKLDDINYCSNPLYKTIVFIILVGILIYFIWFVSRKQYTYELNVSELVSTPFTKLN